MSGIPKWTTVTIGAGLAIVLAQATMSAIDAAERRRYAIVEAARRKAFAEMEQAANNFAASRADAPATSPGDSLRFREAAADVESLTAELDHMASDTLYRTWLSDDIDAARNQLAEAKRALQARKFPRAGRIVNQVRQHLKERLPWVIEQQKKADQQRYIAERMQEALRSLGFGSVSGALAEHPEHPMSAVVIRASGSGVGLEVSVPFAHAGDEQVLYTVSGYRMSQQLSGGRVVTTCDEASDMLADLQDRLAESGLQHDGLHWDNQDPQLVHTRAKTRPGSAPAGRRDSHD